jgi:hypothetical protein
LSDTEDPTYEKNLSRKEFMKKLRKEQYQKQKEAFKNSEYGKQMKERQKQMRKDAYQQAKERKKAYENEKIAAKYPVVEAENRNEHLLDHEIESGRIESETRDISKVDFSKVKLALVPDPQ